MSTPAWEPADERLARVKARLERERAAGTPPRQSPPDTPIPAARLTPRSDEQIDREKKQQMWDAICQHAPELAQMLRELKKAGIKAEVRTLRVEAEPGANHGPDLRPFNAVRIEARLPSLTDLKSGVNKR